MWWLAFLAGMGGLYFYNAREFRKAEDSYPPVGKFVTVDSVKLHYVEEGSGQPVIFLHGNGGQLQDFTMSVFKKVDGKFNAIAFDRPGHGYSERPANEPASLDVQTELIHGALVQIGAVKPILVGHSWSGALVMDYALKYPDEVKGVVLLGGYVYPEEGYPTEALVPVIPILGDLLVRTLLIPVGRFKQANSDLDSYYPDTPPDDYLDLTRTMALRPDEIEATAEDERRIDGDLESIYTHYPGVRVPVVILVGDKDKVVNPETQSFRIHKDIPQSKLIVLHNVGHAIQWSSPRAVLHAIKMITDGEAPTR
jgi:pimeloyl-ACP methyl ester carboxylesterase